MAGRTPYVEKKENHRQRGGGDSLLLFPLPLARNNQNGNIESRILIGCAPCPMKPVLLCRLQGKDCCSRGRILKYCTRWTYKNPDLLSKKSTPFLIFLIPIVIVKAKFWHNKYLQNFQTRLVQWLFFNLEENWGNWVWS